MGQETELLSVLGTVGNPIVFLEMGRTMGACFMGFWSRFFIKISHMGSYVLGSAVLCSRFPRQLGGGCKFEIDVRAI